MPRLSLTVNINNYNQIVMEKFKRSRAVITRCLRTFSTNNKDAEDGWEEPQQDTDKQYSQQIKNRQSSMTDKQYWGQFQEGNTNSTGYQSTYKSQYQQGGGSYKSSYTSNKSSYAPSSSYKPQKDIAFKRFFPKSYVIESPDGGTFLSCYVVPAVFGYTKNPKYQYHSEYYTIHKTGYIVFDFLESKDLGVSSTEKRTFVLTMMNVRTFLDIDPDYEIKVYKRAGRTAVEQQPEDEDKDVYMQFQKQGDNHPIQNLKISEKENRMYELTYFDIINESDIGNQASITVKAGDLKVMQTLVKYAMPCLLGWNGAMDPKVCSMFFKEKYVQ
ncbi:hypothetical protein FGO68_gene5437 [Halteria grandinella]|uniref:Uncharacterized protein n=1 Tax=Halteria grandinella TaxID=5974 RepID=A0A8J8P2D8_HALGN|nr:hypothetical protein FGO68_gene5437 [Halteria grandinella]